MILICQCISTFVSLFFMSSSENTLSTTTLQVAGFNFSRRTLFSPAASGLLQLPRWKWTCNSWCKSISYFLASASPSPSSSWDSSLPVNTTFHAESKPSFVQVTEEAPSGLLHRQLELPPDRPLRGALPLHHFPHSLHLCLSNEFLKKAPFSWALPLFKTPCPSNRRWFVFRRLPGNDFSGFPTRPTAALLRTPLDPAFLLSGKFSGRLFQTGNLFPRSLLVLPIFAAASNLDCRMWWEVVAGFYD